MNPGGFGQEEEAQGLHLLCQRLEMGEGTPGVASFSSLTSEEGLGRAAQKS